MILDGKTDISHSDSCFIPSIWFWTFMMPMSNFGRFCGVCIEMQDQLGFSDPALNLDTVKQPLKCLRIYCLSPGAGWPDCSTMEHGATEVCPATRRLRRPRMRWAHALTQNLASCREGLETKRNRHCRAQARAWWPWGFLAEEYRWGRQWRQWNVFHLNTWTRSWKMTKYDSAERPLTGRDQQSIRKPYQKGLTTGALSALFCGKIELITPDQYCFRMGKSINCSMILPSCSIRFGYPSQSMLILFSWLMQRWKTVFGLSCDLELAVLQSAALVLSIAARSKSKQLKCLHVT